MCFGEKACQLDLLLDHRQRRLQPTHFVVRGEWGHLRRRHQWIVLHTSRSLKSTTELREQAAAAWRVIQERSRDVRRSSKPPRVVKHADDSRCENARCYNEQDHAGNGVEHGRFLNFTVSEMKSRPDDGPLTRQRDLDLTRLAGRAHRHDMT
jgi:hypothetical protein